VTSHCPAVPPIVVTIPGRADVHEAIGYCVIAARRAGMPEAMCDRFIAQAVKAADEDGELLAWMVVWSWFDLRQTGLPPPAEPVLP
jgi:hypothetical protein